MKKKNKHTKCSKITQTRHFQSLWFRYFVILSRISHCLILILILIKLFHSSSRNICCCFPCYLQLNFFFVIQLCCFLFTFYSCFVCRFCFWAESKPLVWQLAGCMYVLWISVLSQMQEKKRTSLDHSILFYIFFQNGKTIIAIQFIFNWNWML